MDLLRTILIYLAMVYVSSVQNAPDPSTLPELNAPTDTPYVESTATPAPSSTPKPTPVPTIDITPNPEYKTIQSGDNGDAVRDLQQKLAEFGYYEGEIDGRFGNQTRRAVERFQYRHGLSADGIAGKRTLTVLYESDEIRPASSEATPAPSPAASTGLRPAASTGAPATATPSPTFAPTEPASSAAGGETVRPSQTPASSASATQGAGTAAPGATPEPAFARMEGYTVWLSGGAGPIAADREDGGEEGGFLAPYACGEDLYVPLLRVLEEAGVNIISTSSLEMDEYAFALGDKVYRIAHSENQAGEPVGLSADLNGSPQALPATELYRVDGTLYLPAESAEALLGIRFELDEAQKRVVAVLPAAEAE